MYQLCRILHRVLMNLKRILKNQNNVPSPKLVIYPSRVITEAQKAKAKEVMAIDYENGWYK